MGQSTAGAPRISIYLHNDGYPEHAGAVLQQYYATPARVRALLALGDLSQLHQRIAPQAGERHTFRAAAPGVTVAYMRDRGERGTAAAIDETADDYWCSEGWEDVRYLYKPSLGWTFRCCESPDVERRLSVAMGLIAFTSTI